MSNADQNSNYISGKTGDWEIVIGLEIHAHVAALHFTRHEGAGENVPLRAHNRRTCARPAHHTHGSMVFCLV